MDNQAKLQTKLEALLGSRNVYYQPPASLLMKYPAIRYSKSNIMSTHADNVKYSSYKQYEIIVIDNLPDNDVIQKILDLPLSSFDRHYEKDGLHHDVIKLYF